MMAVIILNSYISIACLFLLVTALLDNVVVVSSKLRVLLVVVDNRPLNSNWEKANYNTLSSFINKKYADAHSYDFLYVYPEIQNPIEHEYVLNNTDPPKIVRLNENMIQFFKEYALPPDSLPEGYSHADSKSRAVAFSVKFKTFRASAWARILALWHILQSKYVKSSYDYLWYMDSDVVFSTAKDKWAQSLDDFFAQKNLVEYGLDPASSASILMFNNYPWSEHFFPCTGAILLNVQHPLTAYLMKEWWDYEVLKKYNFEHDYEQSGIRKMLHDGHIVIKHFTYLKERQFPPTNDTYWIKHYGGQFRGLSHEDFHKSIKEDLGVSEDEFELYVEAMKFKNGLGLNYWDLSERIHAHRYESIDLETTKENSESDAALRVVHTEEDPNTKYLIQHNMKRLVLEPQHRLVQHVSTSVTITQQELNSFVKGPPLTGDDY